jgi:hypothetical protein
MLSKGAKKTSFREVKAPFFCIVDFRLQISDWGFKKSRQQAGSSWQKTKERRTKTEGFLSVVRRPWSVANKA